jgi:hypothetical protein
MRLIRRGYLLKPRSEKRNIRPTKEIPQQGDSSIAERPTRISPTKNPECGSSAKTDFTRCRVHRIPTRRGVGVVERFRPMNHQAPPIPLLILRPYTQASSINENALKEPLSRHVFGGKNFIIEPLRQISILLMETFQVTPQHLLYVMRRR